MKRGARGRAREVILRRTFAGGLLALVCSAAFARWRPEYAAVDPIDREWFGSQRNPSTGITCCTEADGTFAEEDIRDGAYWTRFEYKRRDGVNPEYSVLSEWMEVPVETIIKDKPNRHGAPVVWWYYLDGNVGIRCYAPGAKG
jgi:hypothetical protein